MKKSLNVQKWKNMLVLLKDLGYALDFFSTPSKHEYFLLIFLFLHYITSHHLFLNVYIYNRCLLQAQRCYQGTCHEASQCFIIDGVSK